MFMNKKLSNIVLELILFLIFINLCNNNLGECCSCRLNKDSESQSGSKDALKKIGKGGGASIKNIQQSFNTNNNKNLYRKKKMTNSNINKNKLNKNKLNKYKNLNWQNQQNLSTIKEEDSQNNKEGNSLYNQNEEENTNNQDKQEGNNQYNQNEEENTDNQDNKENIAENNQNNWEENINENNQEENANENNQEENNQNEKEEEENENIQDNEEENINENNENQNENYEQNQFNEFMRKLMQVESQIEDAKIILGKNPDFNCEDAFRLFESNEKGYLEKYDIKNGLNSIGVNPTEQELNILMKRFDLQKNNFINYADFFFFFVPFEKNLRQEVENRQPKSQDNFSKKTINDLKNVFKLIIQAENDINNDKKNFGTLRLKLKDIFALIDKTGKGFFDIDEMMVYFVNNNLVENNKDADLLFIRLDKNRNGKIYFQTLDNELQVLYYYIF